VHFLVALLLALALVVLWALHVWLANMLDPLVLRLHQKQSKDLVPLVPTLQPVASVQP
jgi:HAMP domain-containing protein